MSLNSNHTAFGFTTVDDVMTSPFDAFNTSETSSSASSSNNETATLTTPFDLVKVLEDFYDDKYNVYKQLDKQVLIACYVPVFLLAVIANTLVIIIVLKFHYMRSITNYFLVNLSVADLLVTLICMPMAVGQSVTQLWVYGEAMCKITYYLQGVAVGASVFTITAMSIDRYLAIRHPMMFRNIFNRKSTLIIICVLWIVAVTIFSPLLWVRQTIDIGITPTSPKLYCLEEWERPSHREIYGTFCFVTVYALPGMVILVAYSLMGKQLCSSAPPFEGDSESAATEQGTRLVRERRRVARILLLLASLFALCWLPYNLLALILDLGYGNNDILMTAFPFALLLGHANSAINPILYCFMTRNFRRTVKEVLLKSRESLAKRKHQRRKIRSPFRSATSSSGYDSYHSQGRRSFPLRTFRGGSTPPHAQYKQNLYQPHLVSATTSRTSTRIPLPTHAGKTFL